MLLTHGALLKCSSLLVSLGEAVAGGNEEEGMELVMEIKRSDILYFILFVAFKRNSSPKK